MLPKIACSREVKIKKTSNTTLKFLHKADDCFGEFQVSLSLVWASKSLQLLVLPMLSWETRSNSQHAQAQTQTHRQPLKFLRFLLTHRRFDKIGRMPARR